MPCQLLADRRQVPHRPVLAETSPQVVGAGVRYRFRLLARLGIADRLQSSLDPGLLANLADNAADRYSAVTSPCRSGAMTFGTAANIRSNASPVIGRPFIGTERASQQ